MLMEVNHARAGSGSAPCMEEGRWAEIMPGVGAPMLSSASRICACDCGCGMRFVRRPDGGLPRWELARCDGTD